MQQLIRVLRLLSAREISLGVFLIFSVGTAVWLTYGVLSHSEPVLAADAATFVLAISILVLKLRFDHNTLKEVTTL